MIRLIYFCVISTLLFSCKITRNTTNIPPATSTTTTFDWQGHRGARGLLPENTIPAFLKALEYSVKTLELDVVITKDKQVILSHEPYMSSEICSKADGSAVEKSEQEQLNIYHMTYNEIQNYDCGSRGNARFPEQQKTKITKVTLARMVKVIEQHTKVNKLPPPLYNIEIKSKAEWDNVFTPEPEEFVQLVLNQIIILGIAERTNIQSFDIRALQVTRKLHPNMKLALLIKNEDSMDANLNTLGFVPDIYSPLHLLLTKEKVAQLHEKGMQVIPWTVNKVERMKQLLEMGVDGIITDYPDKIATARVGNR